MYIVLHTLKSNFGTMRFNNSVYFSFFSTVQDVADQIGKLHGSNLARELPVAHPWLNGLNYTMQRHRSITIQSGINFEYNSLHARKLESYVNYYINLGSDSKFYTLYIAYLIRPTIMYRENKPC